MTKRERASGIGSSGSVGRVAMSMVFLLQALRPPPYDAVRWWCRRGGHLSARPAVVQSSVLLLLRVELDDHLLLDGGVDHLPGRDAVHEHAQLAADDLQPRRHGALAGAGLSDL